MKIIEETIYLLILFILIFFISITAVLIAIKNRGVVDIGDGKIYYIGEKK